MRRMEFAEDESSRIHMMDPGPSERSLCGVGVLAMRRWEGVVEDLVCIPQVCTDCLRTLHRMRVH